MRASLESKAAYRRPLARSRSRAVLRAAAVALLAAGSTVAAARADPGRPLVFLGNKNLAPLVYLEGDAPAGLAVDLVRALAPRLSRPVEIRAMDWPAAQALVARGEADALIQINPSEERRRLYDFSAPLLESQFSIFVRRGSLAVPGAARLRGLTVGVEAGGLPEQALSKDPAIHLVTIPDFLTGFGLLSAYDLDAVVVDWRVGSYVLARNGIRDVTVTGEPVAFSRSAIAVKKGDARLLAELDAALQAIKADGTYERVLARWRPKEVVIWTRGQIARTVAVAAVALLSVLLLSTGLWMMALRRELGRRRAVEAELTGRNAVLAGVVNGADSIIYAMDRAYRYTSFNVAHAATMKAVYGAEVALGGSVFDGVPPPDAQQARELFDRALAGEHVVKEVWTGTGAARRYLRIAHGPIRAPAGDVLGVAVIGQDLTGWKHAEETTRRVNRELRALTSSNKTLLRATDEPSLLREVCRIICDEAGYRMAWIGYAEADEARTLRPVAWAGTEDGYLAAAEITWADTDRGRGPSGTAVRTGLTACAQDFALDASVAPWREAALRRGYRSSIAIPLRDGSGRTSGVLGIYSTEPGVFTPDECRLLEELAGDLALGVNVLRARAELQRAEGQRAAHLHFLESMDRVNRAITGAADLEAMTSEVLDVVLSVLDCDRAFLVHPCDPDAGTWRVPVERCRPEHPRVAALGGELPMEPAVAATMRAALASDAPVRFGPDEPHPIPPGDSERFGFKALLAMAVHPKVGPPWLFGVHQCGRARRWTVDDEWLLQEIGRRLADALSTALVVRDLRESEGRLEKAERMAHLGYWDCDLLAGRIEHSAEACRIHGVPVEERSSDLPSWHERWRALLDPADRDRVTAAVTAAMRGGPRFGLEYRIVQPGGAVRWVHSQGDLSCDDAGRPRRLLGTIQDITDRKRAEEALRRSEEQHRRIVETAHEGIWVVDAQARTTFVNRQMAEMLRCPVEELRGAPITDFLDEEDRGAVGPDLARRREGAGQRELRLERKDGTELWALVELTPFFDETGYTGALAMVTDVTERRAIEAQLRQSQKLEAVGRLAGGVAHDFNNLLTAILSDAQVLAEGLGPDHPLRTEATEIEAAARRAALLTRQLLAFGRKERSEPRLVDVAEVLAAMDRMLRRLIGEDVELTTRSSPGVGRIRVDPVQLEQVLLNLAVNARDAMPRGGRLDIVAENVDAPRIDGGRALGVGPYVMVAVRDTGLGMTAEVQAHLFEPFFTTKEAGKGTGLGLATVYGIVKQAGGEVRVRTEPGKGTAFEIFFPRVEGAAEPALTPAPRAPPRGSEETVLVVEDEPLVRALEVRVLRGAGYTVLEAGDAEQALRLVDGAQRPRIALLLTDVVMPRLSGPELAARLRAARPGLPVLFASGYMDRMQDAQTQVGRGTGFIAKPFTPDELAHKVRELLEHGRSAQA